MAKNIVLLSDGTGNGAAEAFKTNVWRFYQAVNINPPSSDGEPRQVVFYDDGVGTGNFKPIAALGLALGLGLEENIKDLYTFLCRNYHEGDNIFLLGFSRGAFTVRMLAGMVLRCGLVRADNEEKLIEQVDIVYDAYRRDVARRATETGRAKLGGLIFGDYTKAEKLEFVPLGDEITQLFPRIAFIGVWDTVDAYGMPVDEIKLAIDRFIWPMTLADRDLSSLVDRACHALSLDDERPTFRPVLWNERPKDDDGVERAVDEKQLTQVWFAGVHANVGGGYPDDGLSQVTMQWMMDEAQRQGLWVYDEARRDVDNRANPHGKQYDSRTGVAAYYRYGPRSVDDLCSDADHGVKILKPKVHISAANRIKAWEVAYAPVSFPTDYVVVQRDKQGRRLEEVKWLEAQSVQRAKDMKVAWDAVVRRRNAYFATVSLTVALIALPPLAWLVGDESLANVSSSGLPVIGPAMAWVLGVAKELVWSWAGFWLGWYQKHPALFFAMALVLGWLFFRKSALLRDEVFARADYAWHGIRKPARSLEKPDEAGVDRAVRYLRERPELQNSFKLGVRWTVHLLLAFLIGMIGLIVGILFFIPSRYRIEKLRKKYAVGPTAKKDGTKQRVVIERVSCKIQPYGEPVPKNPQPKGRRKAANVAPAE